MANEDSSTNSTPATSKRKKRGSATEVDGPDFDSPWNWKILIENFVEAYHHIGPHRDTFQPTYPAARSTVVDNGGAKAAAARAIGLDVGAMSGFSNKIVDEEFFAGTTLKSNFLCNIGHAARVRCCQSFKNHQGNCTFAHRMSR